MAQEMYDLFKTMNSIAFYALAAVIIGMGVYKKRSNKKLEKKSEKKSEKKLEKKAEEKSDKSLD